MKLSYDDKVQIYELRKQTYKKKDTQDFLGIFFENKRKTWDSNPRTL